MGLELGRAKRNGKRRAKAKRTVTQPLTNPIFCIKMLSDLFMKAHSKNGKISEREPIYGLFIGTGLIWI